jgi:hypothetical protein
MLNKLLFLFIVNITLIAAYPIQSLEEHLEKKALEMRQLAATFCVPNPPELTKKDAKRLLNMGYVDDLVPLINARESEQAKHNSDVLLKICNKPKSYMHGPTYMKRFEVAFKLFQMHIAITADALHAILESECQFDHSFSYRVRDSLLNNEAMFAYFQTKQDLMREIRDGKKGYVSRFSCESLDKALKMLKDPSSAYPDLIKKGEEFIKSAKYEINHAMEMFSDQSYNDRLYSLHDGICKHYQHIFWGFEALTKGFRELQHAETHFTQLGTRKIPFDRSFTGQIEDLKYAFKKAVNQAKGIPQHLIEGDLFTAYKEERLELVNKNIKDAEQQLKSLKQIEEP